MARKKRSTPEINAGSMADIAFLLLIFFLVTTTMDTDTGLRALLPPMPDPGVVPPPFNKRNVFEIRINSANQLLVEGEEIRNVEELTEKTIKFIMNNGRDETLSDNPKKAVVSLQNDRGTDYDIYVQVQDRLREAYRMVRDKASQAKYGRNYDDLTDSEQKIIREEYPQRISEAEPKDLGGAN